MTDRIAAGMMQIGIGRMLDRYPLVGGIVATWKVIEDPSVTTMAVGFDAVDGWRLYYAPAFVKVLPVAELTGVLLHEARHVIFEHCFQTPEQYPDETALRTAQELCVNENMPEPLPKGVILLKDYPQLPADESTNTRYKRLAKQQKKKKKSPPSGSGTSDRNDHDNQDDGNGKESSEDGDRNDAQGSGGSAAESGTDPPNPNEGGSAAPLADDHQRWSEIAAQAAEAREQLVESVEDLREKGVQPSEYERTVIQEASRFCGDQSGQGESLIARALEPRHIPWQVLLRRFVGQGRHRERSFKRPPRRFPHMVGILPGRMRRRSKPTILAVLDTSASMDDELLAELSTELLRLTRTHSVTVVECDAEIHSVYPLTGPITAVHGRGGTSFYPPFEKKFLRKVNPDLVIYLTDGFGDAPKEPPGVPVLWLLTEEIDPPARWGRVVYIPRNSTPTDPCETP